MSSSRLMVVENVTRHMPLQFTIDEKDVVLLPGQKVEIPSSDRVRYLIKRGRLVEVVPKESLLKKSKLTEKESPKSESKDE